MSATRAVLFVIAPLALGASSVMAGPDPAAAMNAAGASVSLGVKGVERVPSPALPAELKAEKISLADAIRTTLDNSPAVKGARMSATGRRGLLQQTSGQFDTTILFLPDWSRTKENLTELKLRPQISQRLFLSEASKNLSLIATDIAKGLTDPNGVPFPDCGGNQYYINGFAVCSDKVGRNDNRSFELLLGAQNFLATNPPDPNDPAVKLQRQLVEQVRQQLEITVVAIRKALLPALDTSLQRIGAVAGVARDETLTLDLRATFQFRDGIAVSPLILMQGTRGGFDGKPDSPKFGGKGPTEYQGVFGFSLDMPLGKGLGRDSFDAQERSAKVNYEAALESLGHAGAQSVFNTVLAYWNLAAAQELLTLYDRTLVDQKKALEVTEALVKGDEVARSELARSTASVADAEAAMFRGRQNVEVARVELARAMGISVTDLSSAPLASDPLPSPDDIATLDQTPLPKVLDTAALSRGDLRAERRRRDAAEVLLKAALSDLKPRIDLSLQAGYNAIYEDRFFDVVSVFNAQGYGRAYGDRYVGPSVQLSLTFQWPFGNNIARGRVVQSEATRNQSDISARNLERNIKIRAEEAYSSVRTAAQEVLSRRSATQQYEDIVRSSYERYRLGESSLLDAILTERGLTQSIIDLVAAKQIYATRVARLKYETGALLPYTVEPARGDVSFGKAEPLGFGFAGRK